MAIQKDAAKDAERLLSTVWDGTVPVDPVQIARTLGLQVLDVELSENIAGALVKRPGRDPYIALNAKDSNKRKRFSCAHEIGHYIKRGAGDEYEYVDLRDHLSKTGTDPNERYANSFAACLLMPERSVRELKRQRGLGEVELAVVFDVSREAMHYRLKDLGLLK
jgi:Zn-dependent peptidase ImmA (M78 family)